MAEPGELVLRFHPVAGEDITVMSRDFADEQEATDTIVRAIDERRSLVLNQARYDREPQVAAVVLNTVNIVSVRVGRIDSTDSGQYL
jgi:hypothetical protein